MKFAKEIVTATALIILFSTAAHAAGEDVDGINTPLKLTLDGPIDVDARDSDREIISFNDIESAESAELNTLVKRRAFEEFDTFDPLLQ